MGFKNWLKTEHVDPASIAASSKGGMSFSMEGPRVTPATPSEVVDFGVLLSGSVGREKAPRTFNTGIVKSPTVFDTALSSQMSQKGPRGLRALPDSVKPDRAPRTRFFDPLSLVYAMGYKDRRFSVSYDTLRRVSYQLSLVSAIINTRVHQITAFAQPYRENKQVGFQIRFLDESYKPTEADKRAILQLEEFIRNCGWGENYYTSHERNDFEEFLGMVVRDSLTHDQLTFEIIPDSEGRPYEFRAVDASTIRLAANYDIQTEAAHKNQEYTERSKLYGHQFSESWKQEHGLKGDFELDLTSERVHTVQVLLGRIENIFTKNDLAFCVRNKRTDIWVNGYGFCLHPKSRVTTTDGPIEIQDLVGKAFKIVLQDEVFPAIAFPTGLRRAYKITFQDGRSIQSSLEHRYYVRNEEDGEFYWKTLGEMSIGDLVACEQPYLRSRADEWNGECVSCSGLCRCRQEQEWGTIPVVSIVDTGEDIEMYDVSVKSKFHGFLVDGIVVHNSEIEQCLNSILALIWAEEYNRRFFLHGSAPKGIINIKGDNVAPEEIESFKRHWHAMVSGVENCVHGDTKIFILGVGEVSIVEYLGGAAEKQAIIWVGDAWVDGLVYKTKEPKILCETVLANGIRLQTSPDHKIKVKDTNGELIWKRQEELCVGDLVQVQRQSALQYVREPYILYDDVNWYDYSSVASLNNAGLLVPMFDVSINRDDHQFIGGGVVLSNSWKTPVIQSEGIEYQNLHTSNQEMEYQRWVEYLFKSITGVYLIDPAEINYDLVSGSNQTIFESKHEFKLKHSRDKGLRPLLKFIAKKLTQYVIAPLDPRLYLDFVGLDELSETDRINLLAIKGQNILTFNEMREREGMKPVIGGDVINNPLFFQSNQAASQMKQLAAVEEGLMTPWNTFGNQEERSYNEGEAIPLIMQIPQVKGSGGGVPPVPAAGQPG